MKQAAVILPYQDNKILMQLRDQKTGIVYPGKWGFFSGTMKYGEEPIETARRELYEEIGYESPDMVALSVDYVAAPDETTLYSFYCPLINQISEIKLQEGFDSGLFAFEEVLSKQLYSTKAKKMFPVIDHPYMFYLVRKLIQKIDGNFSR